MYPQFFGFTKLPFRLRPDAEFLFSGQSYVQTRASTLAALRGGSRLVLLLGPPGVGKTLLLEDVMGEVSGQFAVCRINQPHISATELVQALLLQLATQTTDGEKSRPLLFKELTAALESPEMRNAVPLLVIDDAQLLGAETLKALADILVRVPRLKVLLIGRDDAHGRGDNLAVRLAATGGTRRVNLLPLSAEGTKSYIDHRLKVAGGGGKELFTPDAYGMIFQHSGGSARLINVLCDAALHAACLRASGHVSAAEILAATQDARWPEALARDRANAGAPPSSAAAADPAAGEPAPGAPADSPDFIDTEVSPSNSLSGSNSAVAHENASGHDRAGGNRVPADEPEPAVPAAALVVTLLKRHVTTWPLAAGRISIGRASDNELRLEAPYISRHHCRVVTADNVSIIEDLGSVNGISVNGKLAKRHVLQHADEIALGEHLLTYVVNP
jgi:type II secretory pathway predicted ATPase ExeA